MSLPEGVPGEPVSDELRRAVLESLIEYEVRNGGRVEAVTSNTAVIRYGSATNHVLHLLLTCLTFWVLGGWLWVWLVVALKNASGRAAWHVSVDPWGQPHRTPLPA